MVVGVLWRLGWLMDLFCLLKKGERGRDDGRGDGAGMG